MTPRTWAEGTMPTPEQWLDWLLEQDRVDQLRVGDGALNDAGRAARCVMADHDSLLTQLRSINEINGDLARMAGRYRRAWQSARRRGTSTRATFRLGYSEGHRDGYTDGLGKALADLRAVQTALRAGDEA
ncbi:MAG TPA: hypothetical protein VMF51_18105 [Nocardioides sp.]|uniref:hypothetical protein n=1 Tax=Nocardioides sp. TaxID=35761 RepID=UPI002C0BE5C5|nr:hypothetical protein [Nocardioides sp.]HTW17049.1 hypothetical protein [Nocardioides sp.]